MALRFRELPSNLLDALVPGAGIIIAGDYPDIESITSMTTAEVRDNILGATSGGLTFKATPTLTDFSPDSGLKQTNQYVRLDKWTATLSGNLVTLDNDTLLKLAVGSTYVYEEFWTYVLFLPIHSETRYYDDSPLIVASYFIEYYVDELVEVGGQFMVKESDSEGAEYQRFAATETRSYQEVASWDNLLVKTTNGGTATGNSYDTFVQKDNSAFQLATWKTTTVTTDYLLQTANVMERVWYQEAHESGEFICSDGQRFVFAPTINHIDYEWCEEMTDVNGDTFTVRDKIDSTYEGYESAIDNSQFMDVWWIGEFSGTPEPTLASRVSNQVLAIHMYDALSSGGLQLKTKDQKLATIPFTFTSYYTEETERPPFAVYIGE